MKIYLIRHGQTTADIEDRYGGDYDDDLTELGKKQANELAAQLNGKQITTIYSSPKKRALQTAEIVADKIKAKILVMENLRERNNYGVLTGLTKAEGKLKFPFDVKELEEHSPQHKVKNSERFENFKERVLHSFNTILNEGDENIAVITHSGPIRRILEENIRKKVKEVTDCACIELQQDKNNLTITKSTGLEFE